MRSGKQRHRAKIQSIFETKNSYGEVEKTWTDYATVWASLEPLKGREYWQSQQINAEITGRMKMRYLIGVKPKMRVLYEGREFDILSVINVEERDRELHLMVKERI